MAHPTARPAPRLDTSAISKGQLGNVADALGQLLASKQDLADMASILEIELPRLAKEAAAATRGSPRVIKITVEREWVDLPDGRYPLITGMTATEVDPG